MHESPKLNNKKLNQQQQQEQTRKHKQALNGLFRHRENLTRQQLKALMRNIPPNKFQEELTDVKKHGSSIGRRKNSHEYSTISGTMELDFQFIRQQVRLSEELQTHRRRLMQIQRELLGSLSDDDIDYSQYAFGDANNDVGETDNIYDNNEGMIRKVSFEDGAANSAVDTQSYLPHEQSTKIKSHPHSYRSSSHREMSPEDCGTLIERVHPSPNSQKLFTRRQQNCNTRKSSRSVSLPHVSEISIEKHKPLFTTTFSQGVASTGRDTPEINYNDRESPTRIDISPSNNIYLATRTLAESKLKLFEPYSPQKKLGLFTMEDLEDRSPTKTVMVSDGKDLLSSSSSSQMSYNKKHNGSDSEHKNNKGSSLVIAFQKMVLSGSDSATSHKKKVLHQHTNSSVQSDDEYDEQSFQKATNGKGKGSLTHRSSRTKHRRKPLLDTGAHFRKKKTTVEVGLLAPTL